MYFECIYGSGGGGFVLTVTCESQFAGTTITCTDGTTTLTGTCPSTSPYTIEFAIPNGGIWTVSGILDGSTISESVTIEDSVELHAAPEGSTVLPTDDIQTWLHCANVWNKSYTTISEVLSDASTLQALIASNNAVDYMVRSTTWATDVCADSTAMSLIGLDDYCAETLLSNSTWKSAIIDSTYFASVLTKKVPTMTSNTTPSGLAFAGNNGTDAYKAFDGSTSTYWAAGNSVLTYLGYKFEEPTKIYKVETNTMNSFWITWHVVYSDNGTQSTTVSNSDFTTGGSHAGYVRKNINEDDPHTYWSIAVTSAQSGATSAMSELQFYGR